MSEPTREKEHAEALREVIDRLRANSAVAALVPEHVFGPDQEAEANEWQRCVIVRFGRKFDPRPGAERKNLLVQRDVKVECRGETRDVMGLLCTAAVKTLNGAVGSTGFKQAVHTDSGKPTDESGHWSRTDTFGLFVAKASSAETVVDLPPPQKKAVVAPPQKKNKPE